MVLVLLLCAMLFQPAQQTTSKPTIDNERVSVWELNDSTPARPLDAVAISLSGSAEFLPKGKPAKLSGRSIVIDLKAHAVTPLANTSGYPLAFPRPGSKKLLENERVIVWDYTWTRGVATPLHFHDKDVVVVFLEDGDLLSTAPDGKTVLNAYTAGAVRFNLRDRTHTETLIRGKQHAIITELK
jgi:hypothetical protein